MAWHAIYMLNLFLFISVIDSFKNCIGCHDLRSLGLVFFFTIFEFYIVFIDGVWLDL